MRTAAILAILAASGATVNGQAEPCAISCDPCKDLSKKQCNHEQLCTYSVENDSCASEDAIHRVTIEDGDEKGGVLRKRLQALGCGGFYSQKDCRVARLNGVNGGECWWHDCGVDANGGVPYCGEDRDEHGCDYVLSPDAWAVDNEQCMKPFDDGVAWDSDYDYFYCTIARWFDNAHFGQPILHFLGFANTNDFKNKNCRDCPTRTGADEYPTWSQLASYHRNYNNYLPHIKRSFNLPVEATFGIFHDKACRSGITIYFNKNSELPGMFRGDVDGWSGTNYDERKWGPLITFYQCCSHPVLKSSMTREQYMDDTFWNAIVTEGYDSNLHDRNRAMEFTDYHNDVDVAWNAPADPDAWKDGSGQDDSWSDYFHFLNGDYASGALSDITVSGSDYYNKMVINFKIIIPKSGNAEMDISLPEDVADYTDNVFQTAQRDNAADNDGHPGVRSKRSVPNPFSAGDSVYIHLGGGWMGASNEGSGNNRGAVLYQVQATNEEQLFNINGKETGQGLNANGMMGSDGLAPGEDTYSDYDGDGQSDFGIRMKSLIVK